VIRLLPPPPPAAAAAAAASAQIETREIKRSVHYDSVVVKKWKRKERKGKSKERCEMRQCALPRNRP
jgi:hypothetical protein